MSRQSSLRTGRYVEGVGWMRIVPVTSPRPLLPAVPMPTARARSPYLVYTDAQGSRTFDVPLKRAPAFRDFLDAYLDSRDAAHELPDGSLPA